MIKISNNKFIYREGNEILGYVLFSLNGKDAKITYVYVDERARGMGVSKKLLEYASDYFASKNINVIYECSYAKNWAIKNSRVASL